MQHDDRDVSMLLIDTCGEGAGVAVSVGDQVVVTADLSRSSGSSAIIRAIEDVMHESGHQLAQLSAIAVVNGPGSFTGVRVGLAAASGLAEAAQLRMLTVSRLKVLAATTALKDGWVVLDAGHSGCYAMSVIDGRYGPEMLLGLDSLRDLAGDSERILADERVGDLLQNRYPELRVRVRPLRVADALPLSLGVYKTAELQTGSMEANYLQGTNDIYKAKPHV